MELHFGDLPTWIAAVGTVLAFFGTLAVIRRDHAQDRERHEEELWDRALDVDAEFDPTLDDGWKTILATKAWVVNKGRRPIFDVHLAILARSEDMDVVATKVLSQVPANARGSIPLPTPDDMWGEWGGGRRLSPSTVKDVLKDRFGWIIFWVDTSGRRWMRSSLRYLERVSDEEWSELVAEFQANAGQSEQVGADEARQSEQVGADEARQSEQVGAADERRPAVRTGRSGRGPAVRTGRSGRGRSIGRCPRGRRVSSRTGPW